MNFFQICFKLNEITGQGEGEKKILAWIKDQKFEPLKNWNVTLKHFIVPGTLKVHKYIQNIKIIYFS